MTAYIDLNIFDRLEKLDKLDQADKEFYQTLYNLLDDKKITTAYSNAHLNDLFRGYQKNPTYIDGHLATLNPLQIIFVSVSIGVKKMLSGITETLMSSSKKKSMNGNLNRPLMMSCLKIIR
jgi:hypothetical protein